MGFFKELFERLKSNDRRRSERQPSPSLAAYYWTGGAPKEHAVRDISFKGLFLVTEERWYPGTLVMMSLQKRDNPGQSISIQTKAVRWDGDGVGLEFVPRETKDAQRDPSLRGTCVDRKTLDMFLEDFRTDNGHALIEHVDTQASSPHEFRSDK